MTNPWPDKLPNYSMRLAAYEAAKQRLRPILLTSLTFIRVSHLFKKDAVEANRG